MLQSLHVKNLALIKDIELNFGPGLNILTGETGAGKSILLGSVSLALGCRADADLIRTGEEEAFVELVFAVEREDVLRILKEMDVDTGDGIVVITRKIWDGRSQGKINGETVTSRKLREVSSLLIDIHGQHEHQSLLNEGSHLPVIDLYGKSAVAPLKEAYENAYRAYRKRREALKAYGEDPEKAKEILEFMAFEIDEIEKANVKKGEEAALLSERKRLTEAGVQREQLSTVLNALTGETEGHVSEAVRAAAFLEKTDPAFAGLRQSLTDLEAVLQDIIGSASDLVQTVQSDEARIREIEERLTVLSRLKHKYGGSEEKILETLKDLIAEHEKRTAFEAERENVRLLLKQDQKALVRAAADLHAARCAEAVRFDRAMEHSLTDLNFLEVHFMTELTETNRYRIDGADDVRFLISANPGEPLKPLSKVASGGELSRIMLAIKAEIAGLDGIDTMIFDEIDTGISGKTASAVARRMMEISKGHQVICISHLPQIAAAADRHFLIEKRIENGETVTRIHALSEEESLKETARLLGSEDSPAAYENAKEIRNLIRQGQEGRTE